MPRISILVLLGTAAACTCCQGCHYSPILAVWLMRQVDEYAMKSWPIGSRPGYQGGQACNIVQWSEDDVDSTISISRLQLVAAVTV